MFIFIAKTQYIVAGCHVTDISVKVGVEGHNPFGAVSLASLSVMGSATTGFLRYIRTILAGLGTKETRIQCGTSSKSPGAEETWSMLTMCLSSQIIR
jgi:hypothetical protein